MLVYRKKVKDGDDDCKEKDSKKESKKHGSVSGDKGKRQGTRNRGISFDRGNKGIYLPGAGS